MWETSNAVLGRQESASIRTPKKILNLVAGGVTTADDIRAAAAGGRVAASVLSRSATSWARAPVI
jgi:hypothetical protein